MNIGQKASELMESCDQKCNDITNCKCFQAHGRPGRYQPKFGDVDIQEFVRRYELTFNNATAVKYICRAGKKGSKLDDLNKAKDCIEKEIDFIKRYE